MCVVSSVDTFFDLSLDCDKVLQPYVKNCLSEYGRREERKEVQQSEPRAEIIYISEHLCQSRLT